MSLSAETRRAVIKYGPSVDRLARRRYGVSGAALLAKLITGESGDRKNAVSSAGARGRAQFMPGTRRAALRYGVDPWRSSDEAVHAAALHLRGKLTGSKGLEGYNPGGGRKYVDYILHQKVGRLGHDSRAISQGSSGVHSSVSVRQSSQTSPTFNQGAYQDALRARALAFLFSRHPGGSVLTRTGILSTAPVNPDDFKGSVTTKRRQVRGSQGSPPGGRQTGGNGPLKAGRLPGGKIIGVPYQGTHTVGNWQSDNAVDIALHPGTPVRSVTDGVVIKVSGNPRDTGRFGGIAVTIKGPHGGTFYTHLRSARVKSGQRIRRGDVIGGSGIANGVAHLHFGVEHGDPRRYK